MSEIQLKRNDQKKKLLIVFYANPSVFKQLSKVQSILFIRGFFIRGIAYSRYFFSKSFFTRIPQEPWINIYPRIFRKNRE